MTIKKLNVPRVRFPGFQGEWEEKRLGDIADIIGGGTPSTETPNYWNGEINWYTPTEIKDGIKHVFQSNRKISEAGLQNSGASMLPHGTILLTTRASLGDMAISKTPAATNQGFQSLIVKDCVSNEFVYYYQPRIKKHCIKYASGSTFKEISKKNVASCRLFVPSLPEQQKIASFLSLLDQRIEKQQEKISCLEEYKKGLMQKIFSQEIRFKDANGEDYPEWEEKRLGDIGVFYRGHSYSRDDVKTRGLIVLRSNNIQEGWIDVTDLQFVDKPCRKEILLRDGDIAVCMSNGSKKLVGKAAIIEGDIQIDATVGAFCSVYRSNHLLKRYLFQTIAYKKSLHLLLAGTNINNLKNNDLAQIKFFVPSDSKEQQKIGQVLSKMDELIIENKELLEQWKLLKKGLLQQMFI